MHRSERLLDGHELSDVPGGPQVGQQMDAHAEAREPSIQREPDDRALDLEFAFTSWRESCRDPHPTLQQCRRRAGHEGQHAAGFGAERSRWGEH